MARKPGQKVRNGIGYAGSSWFYIVYMTDKATGQRRQVKKRGFETRQDAERAKAEAQVKKQRGTLTQQRKTTLNHWLDKWLDEGQSRWSPNTFDAYESKLRVHVRPHIGGLRLDTITRDDVKALITALGKAGVSPATIRAAHRALSVALNEAVASELIHVNPCSRVKLPSAQPYERPTPSDEQAQALMAVAQQHRLYFALRLAAVTGARPSELQGLRWSDVDLGAGVITWQRARLRSPRTGETFERPWRKNGLVNVMQVDEQVISDLQGHRLRQVEERLKAGDLWVESGYVFTKANGEPLNGDALTQLFPKLQERAGWPKGMTLYSLRHWAGTALHEDGIPAAVAARRMGYKNATTYLNRYVHSRDKAAAAAASVTTRRLSGASDAKVMPKAEAGVSVVPLHRTESLTK